ncbi:hypothetical protein [Paenibacillus dendritiformis]|uniref:hypothetical protein n=1 Tax=Paenibacillus dendritiformis TaxID=130049 RepID=UPI00105A136A|nr:hypothetical protein [Paenibacillus dendritiformis]TDL49709.1 hypothetical protein E2R60_23560 [Paenibacillus dendritiformis]
MLVFAFFASAFAAGFVHAATVSAAATASAAVTALTAPTAVTAHVAEAALAAAEYRQARLAIRNNDMPLQMFRPAGAVPFFVAGMKDKTLYIA